MQNHEIEAGLTCFEAQRNNPGSNASDTDALTIMATPVSTPKLRIGKSSPK